MGREHRIIARARTDAGPGARGVRGTATTPTVIGAPFYVMAYVERHRAATTIATAIAELDARRPRAQRRVAGRRAGRAARGRRRRGRPRRPRPARRAASARQLKRWHAQFEASKTRELPAVDRVHELLAGAHPRADREHRRARRLPARQLHRRPARRDPARCSTGRSARSATRAPTSATCWRRGPSPAIRCAPTTTTPRSRRASRRATRCWPATRSVRAATSPRSRTSSPSRSGAWRASSRACWPATCRARAGEGGVDLDYFRRRVESCAQLAEEYARSL